MGNTVPDGAPDGIEPLVDWADEHADTVGVAGGEDQGIVEVSVELEQGSLLVTGTLGQDGNPGDWDSASLLTEGSVQAETLIQFPQPPEAPPVVYDEEEDTLSLRTVDAELQFSPGGGGEDEDQSDDEE